MAAAPNLLTYALRPGFHEREKMDSGVESVNALTGGCPRGGITEVYGPESSGRTTFLQAVLAAATARQEICAYVDACHSLDPCSAAAAGVVLSQLLWVRCCNDIEATFQVTDHLLHAGGFGVIVMDLCQIPERQCRRIPLSYWYRFRRALENTPTVLLLLEREPMAKSCASLQLQMTRKKTVWSGAPGFHLLREVDLEAASRKPVSSQSAHFSARAIA